MKKTKLDQLTDTVQKYILSLPDEIKDNQKLSFKLGDQLIFIRYKELKNKSNEEIKLILQGKTPK